MIHIEPPKKMKKCKMKLSRNNFQPSDQAHLGSLAGKASCIFAKAICSVFIPSNVLALI